ncbi:CatA-like O-acetyltransferase [Pseudoalteromonas denitrificans]|uniref:Chloramphenicol O-acetyltransferase type A n=1 Tax=Pseudoalteromonas denitrificans DSM 6059 TaxID=1123010 RepID=A0A1I1IRD1_9GAMM|nr:CatA-like O-acetyltransferase [Pseudoalteromonas denitrificans]SFC38784.1 chloramphenicol O-acetyltransferase type A [Pseudoalteromonas denitrificans DSM 6059]
MENVVKLDLKNWSRAQHFEFFKGFSNPYFNVTVNLNLKRVFNFVKENDLSFFQSYLFLTLKAVNNCKPMCLRISNEDVLALKKINTSVVQLCDDETFRFSYIDFIDDFKCFAQVAVVAAQKAKNDLFFSKAFQANEGQLDTVHISVLPWMNFTSFSHATHLPNESGIPKLVFGEYDKETGKMPMSVEVHHALMDGVHVAKFTRLLQEYCDDPALNLMK